MITTNCKKRIGEIENYLRNGQNNFDSVRPQVVDFGSEQGLSNFETGGIAGYVEDFKRAETPLWAKRCRLWMDNRYQDR